VARTVAGKQEAATCAAHSKAITIPLWEIFLSCAGRPARQREHSSHDVANTMRRAGPAAQAAAAISFPPAELHSFSQFFSMTGITKRCLNQPDSAQFMVLFFIAMDFVARARLYGDAC
jgi:hypothetical protein